MAFKKSSTPAIPAPALATTPPALFIEPSDVVWGDIWTQPRGILVHGCNAQGVMGKGAALGFKRRFPRAFQQYREAWQQGRLSLGRVEFCPLGEGLWGACAITQDRYGRGQVLASLPAIQKAFAQVKDFALREDLPVFYIRVGAGLAGGVKKPDGSVGGWETIHPVIEQALKGVEHRLVEWGTPAQMAPLSRAVAQPLPPAPPIESADPAPSGSSRTTPPGRIWGVKKQL